MRERFQQLSQECSRLADQGSECVLLFDYFPMDGCVQVSALQVDVRGVTVYVDGKGRGGFAWGVSMLSTLESLYQSFGWGVMQDGKPMMRVRVADGGVPADVPMGRNQVVEDGPSKVAFRVKRRF